MRVAVVEDSGLFRHGLVLQLQAGGVEVVAECRSADEMLARLNKLDADGEKLDVVITDIRMPPTHTDEGIVLAEQLRRERPELGILVLSAYADVGSAFRLLEAADERVGYLLKDKVDDVDVLREALERIVSGGTVIESDLIQGLFGRRSNTSRLSGLSPRDREVLGYIAEGLSNVAIGTRMSLSTKTVEARVSAVFDSLGLVSATDTNRRVMAALEYLRMTDRPVVH